MKKIKLENIVDIYNGSTPSTTDVENFGGEIPWVTPKDLADQQKKYISRGERNITEKGLASIGNCLLPTGTILLTSRAPIGLIALSSNPISTNQGFKNIVCDSEKIHNEYLFYKLQTLIPFLQNSGTGTTFKELSKSTLEKISFSIHTSTKTQQEIAKVLYDLDAKIALNNRINEVLEAKAKLLYDYWFVQFEFPASGASAPLSPLDGSRSPRNGGYKSSGGKMVYNKKLKREIPEGWEVKRLEELGDFKNGVNYDPSKPGPIACPIINVRNISASTYFIKNDDLDVIYLKQSEADKYMVNDNSIIIARSGIPGATRLINEHLDNTLYCGFAIHFDLKDVKQKNILFFFLKSIEMMIQSGAGGTIMKNVNQQTLKKLLVSMPKENEIIKEFNKQLEPIFNRIKNIQKQNQHLASLRDWLLPMLMNGQVGVERAYEIVDGEFGMVAEPGEKYE